MSADWRFFLTTRSGGRLREITTLATERKGSWRLNRPASVTLRVPADDPRIASRHSDGLPLLATRARGLKAYRKEFDYPSNRFQYVLRFAGWIYAASDDGDENGVFTTITALDPLQELAKRLCRDGTGNYPNAEDTRAVAFANTDAGVIGRALIERANAVSYTGLTTTATGTTPLGWQTVAWERKFVLAALLELSESEFGFDMLIDPVDRTDYVFANFTAVAQMGSYKANVKFNWGGGGKSNVRRINRLEDGLAYVSSQHGLGSVASATDPDTGTTTSAQLISVQYSAGSIAIWGLAEDVRTYGDMVDQAFLDSRVVHDLALTKQPRNAVTIYPLDGVNPAVGTAYGQPQPSVAPRPWDNFVMGDSFDVFASSEFRGGFQERQRCHGWDISMDDVESVTALITTPADADLPGSGGGGG